MNTTIGRARCALCGARLRQGRAFGELCDPCQRPGSDRGRTLPTGFYRRAAVVAMPAVYDFGSLFAEVRQVTGWTQQTLAGVVGLTQSHISTIERGEHRLRDIEIVAMVARGLAIPPALLRQDYALGAGPIRDAAVAQTAIMNRPAPAPQSFGPA